MTLDDSGDEAKGDAAFLIDSGDTETDSIQSAGHVDGAIQLGLGIDTGLESNKEHAVLDTGDNSEIVGVGHDLLQGCAIGIFRGLFDGQAHRIDLALGVVADIHDSGHHEIARSIQISDIGEPLPGHIPGIDLGINAASLNRHRVVADRKYAAGHQDAGLDAAGSVVSFLPL